MSRISRWATAVACLLATAAPLTGQGAPVEYELQFTTTGQSIWNTGASFRLDETKFLGATFEDKTLELDAFVGNEDTRLPNPARGAWDTACLALGVSTATCVNGRAGRIFVPKLGSRPRVRSCKAFQVKCGIARAGDIARRAAYDVAYKACRAYASASQCRNGQSLVVPIPALGPQPPATLSLGDTRTGAGLEAEIEGRAGLELGIEIDSGSLDATVTYEAMLDVPDVAGLDKSVPISFNPSSTFGTTNTLSTNFSSVELSVDAVLDLEGSITAEACGLGNCVGDTKTFDIDERASILGFNQGGNGEITLLGQPPSFWGISGLDGFPLSFDINNLAEITLHFPNPDATGGLDPSTGKLTATGQDDLLDLFLDVDNIITTAFGAPGLLGSELPLGSLGSVGFDIINFEAGPTIDLQQDFELEPTLYVRLDFDKDVLVAGEVVSFVESEWELLPDITFLDDITWVTPTFFLDAEVSNETLLDFDLEFVLELLQLTYDFPGGVSGFLGVGDVLKNVDASVDLFDTPALYSNLFPLQGFDLQVADPFVMDFTTGSTSPAPSTRIAAVTNVLLPAIATPEPHTPLLLLAGLAAALGLGRSRRRAARARRPAARG